MLAVLKHEGVIKDAKKRGYECGDIAKFVSEIKQLMTEEPPRSGPQFLDRLLRSYFRIHQLAFGNLMDS